MKNEKNKLRNLMIAVLAICLLQSSVVRAAFGDPDLTFGSSGIFTDTTLDYAPTAMARQADGKIVAVGERYDATFGVMELVVRRYLADGSVDTAFGWGGRAIPYDIGGRGRDVVIQTDGKISVVGVAPLSNSTAVWRFNANGGYDSSYGVNGRVIAWGNGSCNIASFKPGVVTANELIIACQGGEMFRLKPNGTVNTSFGSGGLVNLIGGAAMIVKSGSIYVAGGQNIGKYSLTGVPDPSFGTSGWFNQQADYSCLFTVSGGNYKSLAVQSDGTIVVFGSVDYNLNNYDAPHLSAHQTNGSFKPAFTGSPCPASTVFSMTFFNLRPTVRIDASNRIVTAASNLVERRSATGALDGSYSLSTQTISDVEILSDSRILTIASKNIGGVTRARLSQRLP